MCDITNIYIRFIIMIQYFYREIDTLYKHEFKYLFIYVGRYLYKVKKYKVNI